MRGCLSRINSSQRQQARHVVKRRNKRRLGVVCAKRARHGSAHVCLEKLPQARLGAGRGRLYSIELLLHRRLLLLLHRRLLLLHASKLLLHASKLVLHRCLLLLHASKLLDQRLQRDRQVVWRELGAKRKRPPLDPASRGLAERVSTHLSPAAQHRIWQGTGDAALRHVVLRVAYRDKRRGEWGLSPPTRANAQGTSLNALARTPCDAGEVNGLVPCARLRVARLPRHGWTLAQGVRQLSTPPRDASERATGVRACA